MLRSRIRALAVEIRSSAPARCRRSRSYHSSYNRSKPHKDINQIPLSEAETSKSWKDRLVTPVAISMIAGVGAAALYLHYNDERRATPLGTSKTKGATIASIRPAIGGAFKLIDTERRIITDSDLQGNWVLMYFGYTSSPDVCPEEAQKLAKVADMLETKNNLKITPVFITIDPQRDSSSQLRAYLREIDPRILGLTGRFDAIRQVAHEYRVFFKKVEEESKEDYLVESSNNMYLLDPHMEMVKYFGPEYDALQLADGILDEVKKTISS